MYQKDFLDAVVAEIKPKFPKLTMIVLIAADEEGVSIVAQSKPFKTELVPTAIRVAADFIEDEGGEPL